MPIGGWRMQPRPCRKHFLRQRVTSNLCSRLRLFRSTAEIGNRVVHNCMNRRALLARQGALQPCEPGPHRFERGRHRSCRNDAADADAVARLLTACEKTFLQAIATTRVSEL